MRHLRGVPPGLGPAQPIACGATAARLRVVSVHAHWCVSPPAAVATRLVAHPDRGGRACRSAGGQLPRSADRLIGVRRWFPTCPIQPCLYSSGMTVLTRVNLDTLARVGTALADPTRRRVLVQLTSGSGYPAEMAEEFGTSRANLSNHLTCLRECGLVTATAEGRRVRYELADQRLAEGLRILAALDLPGTCG